ncbi:hypothetical protein TNCV_697271 [Trichonephila clavipes]|nr:hypothetical protein TNCV_697271 [Trichonephila clavipes]
MFIAISSCAWRESFKLTYHFLLFLGHGLGAPLVEFGEGIHGARRTHDRQSKRGAQSLWVSRHIQTTEAGVIGHWVLTNPPSHIEQYPSP